MKWIKLDNFLMKKNKQKNIIQNNKNPMKIVNFYRKKIKKYYLGKL